MAVIRWELIVPRKRHSLPRPLARLGLRRARHSRPASAHPAPRSRGPRTFGLTTTRTCYDHWMPKRLGDYAGLDGHDYGIADVVAPATAAAAAKVIARVSWCQHAQNAAVLSALSRFEHASFLTLLGSIGNDGQRHSTISNFAEDAFEAHPQRDLFTDLSRLTKEYAEVLQGARQENGSLAVSDSRTTPWMRCEADPSRHPAPGRAPYIARARPRAQRRSEKGDDRPRGRNGTPPRGSTLAKKGLPTSARTP